MRVILNGAGGRMGRVLQTMIAGGRQGSSLAAAVDALDAEQVARLQFFTSFLKLASSNLKKEYQKIPHFSILFLPLGS